MPFRPDTTIYLFKGTKVSPTDQPFFASEGAKIAWYMSHDTMQFTAQSFQREQRQYARLHVAAATIRGYDMMAYRNSDSDRWILCNITGTEFVNPNTTDVFFETDSMQTWIDSIEWRDCWVEREMVQEDWNGSLPGWKSTVVEGLNTTGNYVEGLGDATDRMTEGGWTIHVLSAYDSNANENYDINTYGRYISGLNDIKLLSAAQLGELLKAYADKGRLDGIVGVWIYPSLFTEGTGTNITITLPTTIAGYTPKNSKCFSSEFCTVEVTNGLGDSIQYLPEFLFPATNTHRFNIYGYFLDGGGGIRCTPTNYMGIAENATRGDADYCAVLPANIQCAYVGDAFANWVSQNKVGIATELLSAGISVAAGAAGIVTAPTAGVGALTAVHGIESAMSTLSGIASKHTNPAAAYGQASSLSLPVATNTFGFRFYLRSPGYDVIKSIDDYFSVFGYKVCKMKKPNVNTRPYWNYVKCAPAIVGGPMNYSDRTNIEAMLNAGVTFWNVQGGATIGDYSPDNRG